LVGGRIELDGSTPSPGTTVSLRRDDNGWNSGEISVDSKGMFFASAKIRDKGQSVFEISVRGADGQQIPCTPNSLAITYGLQISSSPLPAGVGIALADGGARIMHAGGSLLPRPEEIYKAQFTRGLKKGSAESLSIPVLSGDDPVAEYNRCGTVITIKGTDLAKDIPAGSDVEIGISVDSSGVPSVRAFVPILDETFEPNSKTELAHEPAVAMRGRKRSLIARLERTEEQADGTSIANVSASAMSLRLSDEMDEIDLLIDSWEKGDEVAAGQARNHLVDLSKRAQELADKVELPAAIAEYNKELDDARKAAAQFGDASDRKAIDDIARDGSKAVQAGDSKMLQHCIKQLRSVEFRLIAKDPSFWVSWLQHLSSVQNQFSDKAAARRLLLEGAQAVQRSDVNSVRSIVQQLLRMLPPDTAKAISSSLGSDVM